MEKSEIKAKADNAYVSYIRLSKKGSEPSPNFDPKNGTFDIERDICKANALESHGQHVAYMDVYNSLDKE